MREASLQRTVSAYLGRADKLESTMANDYASNFGDVVKHAVLGAAIENERPVRYLESHGGRLDYDLAELTPGGRRCVRRVASRKRQSHSQYRASRSPAPRTTNGARAAATRSASLDQERSEWVRNR